MNCPHCGAAFSAPREFCSECLGNLAQPNAAETPAPAPIAREPEAPIERPCPLHPNRPLAGTCSRCGTFICISCVPDLATASHPLCQACHARVEQPEASASIGGWLILPMIGLFIVPFTAIYQCIKTVGFLDQATGARQGLIAVEALYSLVVCVYCTFTLVQFLQRKRRTPALMVLFYAGSLCFQVADISLAYALHGHVSGAGFGRIFRGVIGAGVWIPYFLVSQRVKRTFVL